MAGKRKGAATTEKQQENGQHNEQEVKPEAGLAVRPQGEVTQWTPRFAMTVDEAVELENQKQQFMQRVLKDGVHYGMIPGAGKRKVLFKPGAEALCAAMGLHPEMLDAEPPVRDYTGADHGGEPFWSFRSVCRIYRQTGPGPDDRMLVAQAGGSCNSFEVKYRYRQQERLCPVCNKSTVFRSKGKKDGTSKPEDLGYYCWKVKGGCGAQFRHDDKKIIEQKVGRIANEDVFDLENTGLKMSHKRALVAATLIATGFSTDFTQDLEDKVPDEGGYGNEYVSGDYVEPRGGPEAGDTQTSASVDRQAAPAPKASGSAQTAPAPPPAPAEVSPEVKLMRQVVTSLGNSLDPPWAPNDYVEGSAAMGKDYRLFIGTLVELHMVNHGSDCAHIKAVPAEVDYRYPSEGIPREWANKMKDKLMAAQPQGADIDPDDIPF